MCLVLVLAAASAGGAQAVGNAIDVMNTGVGRVTTTDGTGANLKSISDHCWQTQAIAGPCGLRAQADNEHHETNVVDPVRGVAVVDRDGKVRVPFSCRFDSNQQPLDFGASVVIDLVMEGAGHPGCSDEWIRGEVVDTGVVWMTAERGVVDFPNCAVASQAFHIGLLSGAFNAGAANYRSSKVEWDTTFLANVDCVTLVRAGALIDGSHNDLVSDIAASAASYVLVDPSGEDTLVVSGQVVPVVDSTPIVTGGVQFLREPDPGSGSAAKKWTMNTVGGQPIIAALEEQGTALQYGIDVDWG